ncbi:MAG: hypothetical protein LBC64_00040 [Fibromonadaceae bacterium]|jgi:hypothetical protein|nr:hypothetical protein [Fibromonadaceae bacterium]
MKKILFAVTIAIFASTQAFAIAGIGAHYITNTGSLGASDGLIGNGLIYVEQEKSEGLKGLGFKLWIDLLPLVDIEGTFNIAATRYNTILTIPTMNKTIPLTFPVEAPYSMLFDEAASPIYGIATGDVSVTYPFDVIPLITPYIGLGVSYFISTPVVNAAFVENVLANTVDFTDVAGLADGSAFNNVGSAVVDALKNSDYESGMGGHIIAGVRVKPPVIPIAAYANCKYYFGGNTNSKFSQGLVLEVGGGFAL